MSDSLLMLLEMIEEALKEAKRDAVPDTLARLVPIEKASEAERAVYDTELQTIQDPDGTSREIEVVRIPITLKTNTGLGAEKHLKASVETHFKSRGQRFSDYKVGDPQGSGPNPDIVVTTPTESIAFEVKNSPGGLVDYGQSDLFFNGQEWVLVSDNPELRRSFDSLKNKIPVNLDIPINTVSVSIEQAKRLANEGLRASVEVPVTNIANYYAPKNRFIFIRNTDSVYCLRKDDPLIKEGIPYFANSVSGAITSFRIKNQGKKASPNRRFRFKLTQRIASDKDIEAGMGLDDALPLIFP